MFQKSRIPVRTVLDLACGTGEMTAILTRRGYELIAVDGSHYMLAQAREKAADLPGDPPVFL
ncbi:MAG: class I SAM-dependent methyltransferase, partial [Lachnospiraceae bacterium]|nr:class I SAM-dependent methyltransferase [Lachnospiraceae bacterium]